MKAAFTNPVYPHECADPFVLKHKGQYWCYHTGGCPDGRIFGVLRSTDLAHWEASGSAMDPLPGVEHYWAPEVFYTEGRFYLYYAAGNELNFHLRAAVAEQPQGPFIDNGRRLTQDLFAIDAHVFEDEDGQRYLFYAVDFLDHPRVGTGTVVDRLLDPFTLEGKPHPVSRARFDWQIFDPHRLEKGGVQWHTIEGSFALRHKGRYYQMFSGGNFNNPSYGVGYAVSSAIDPGGEWDQPVDGLKRLPILRTVPGRVNGPGHNSVVRGPDNRQLFCAYHVIKPQERFERVLAVDPLEWVGERLAVLGPSSEPRPSPILPTAVCALADPAGQVRTLGTGEILLQPQPGSPASGSIPRTGAAFLLEASLRFPQAGISRLTLGRAALILDAREKRAALALGDETLSWQPLPAAFAPQAIHLLRLEVDGRACRLSLDHVSFRWQGALAEAPDRLRFIAEDGALEVSAIQITRGCEADFSDPDFFASSGWQVQPGGSAAQREGRLSLSPAPGGTAHLSRLETFRDAEFVANLSLEPGASCAFPLRPACEGAELGRLVASQAGLEWQAGGQIRQVSSQPWPAGELGQVRLRKAGAELLVAREGEFNAPLALEDRPFAIAVEVSGARVEFDLLRLTEIPG